MKTKVRKLEIRNRLRSYVHYACVRVLYTFICTHIYLRTHRSMCIMLNQSHFCQRRENPSKYFKSSHSRRFLCLCLLTQANPLCSSAPHPKPRCGGLCTGCGWWEVEQARGPSGSHTGSPPLSQHMEGSGITLMKRNRIIQALLFI